MYELIIDFRENYNCFEECHVKQSFTLYCPLLPTGNAFLWEI